MPRGLTDHPLSRKVKASRILSLKYITSSYAIETQVRELSKEENLRDCEIHFMYVACQSHQCPRIWILDLLDLLHSYKLTVLYPHSTGKVNLSSSCYGLTASFDLFLALFCAKDFGSSIAGQQLPPQHGQPLLAQDAVRSLPRRRDSASFAG